MKDIGYAIGSVILAAILGLAAAVCLAGCLIRQATPERALFSRTALSSVVITDELGGVGSGTVVKADGDRALVLTAAHVIADTKTLVVDAVRGSGIVTKVLKTDEVEDLALVEVRGPLHAPALPIASREPERYDRAWLVGAYHGMPRTPSDALVGNTSFERAGITEGRKHAMYAIVTSLYQGDSGGTLVNERGELIAVPQRLFDVAAPTIIPTPIGSRPAPFYAVEHLFGVGLFAGLWSIRDFLKGTEVLP